MASIYHSVLEYVSRGINISGRGRETAGLPPRLGHNVTAAAAVFAPKVTALEEGAEENGET